MNGLPKTLLHSTLIELAPDSSHTEHNIRAWNVAVSHRVSDMTLVFVLAQEETSTDEDVFLPPPPPVLLLTPDLPSVSNAGGQIDAASTAAKNGECVARYPAHKIILMGGSIYFNTRLCTELRSNVHGDDAVGPFFITEHAASLDKLHALTAVMEFLYTNKLPSVALAGVSSVELGDRTKNKLSPAQRLLSILTVHSVDVQESFPA